MRNRYIIAAVMLILFAGCGGGKAVVNKYYLLEYPRLSTMELLLADSLTSLGGSCFIAQVDVHPAYASHQIVIRESSNQINYFSFNEWAVRPSQSLTAFITDFLTDADIFTSINAGRVALGNDFLLETSISKLEVVRAKPNLLAHVDISFTLRDLNTGSVVARHHGNEMKILEEKDLNQFAAAVSSIVAEQLHAFVQQINDVGQTP